MSDKPSKTRKAEHLKVDPPVEIICHKPSFTQNYALISFLSPEDRIKQRFMFEANRFLYHDVNKQIMDTTSNLVRSLNTEFTQMVNRKIASYKSSKDPVYQASAELLESVMKELQLNEDSQVSKTLRSYRIDQQELSDRFEAYKTQNNKELEAEFNTKFTNETSIRGFKVRGTYETMEEAKTNASKIHKEVESTVHTFVAPVGYWCPWDPTADAIQDQETMIPALDSLMAKKKENEQERDDFFLKRKQMMMDKAEEDRRKQLEKKLRDRVKEQREQRSKK